MCAVSSVVIQTHVFSDTDFVTKSIDSGCALEAGYNFPGWNPASSVVIYLCILPKEPNKTANLLQNKLTSLHLHRHTDRHTLMNLTSLGLFFLHQDFCFFHSEHRDRVRGCSLDQVLFSDKSEREETSTATLVSSYSTNPSVSTDRCIHMYAFFPSNKSDQSLDQKIFHIKLFFTSF